MNNRFRRLAVALVTAALFVGSSVAVWAEWREPSAPPPVGNFSAPITIDGQNQTKSGYLKLDPEGYNPTESESLIFETLYPLQVTGEGARFGSPTLRTDWLRVGSETAVTLYASDADGWMGIATETRPGSNPLLAVSGRVVVSATDSEAIRAYSDSVGIYAETDVSPDIDHLGIAVQGVQAAGTVAGVSGVSAGGNGVRGESGDGYGVYGIASRNPLMAGVYASNDAGGLAGYFDGRLASRNDFVAPVFFPTALPRSHVPSTYGQETGSFDVGDWGASFPAVVRTAFDGTYLWVSTDIVDSNGKTIFAVRPSDGETVREFDGVAGIQEMVFDGQNLWVATTGNGVSRVSRTDGTVAAVNGGSVTDLAVSTQSGSVSVWATIPSSHTILKINAADLSVTTFISTSFEVAAQLPHRVIFDGEYVWVATTSGHLLRLLAADPNTAPVVIDTGTFPCVAAELLFDGAYVWCAPDAASGQLVRFWADDPSDANRPPTSVETLDATAGIAFDGAFVWVADTVPTRLKRYVAGKPHSETSTEVALAYAPRAVTFDGVSVWAVEVPAAGGPVLHRYFSGTGDGYPDLGSMVRLSPPTSQTGNVHVSESVTVSGAATVGTDVDVPGNLWGGADDTVSINGGTADCDDGQFVKGITIDNSGVMTQIICSSL